MVLCGQKQMAEVCTLFVAGNLICYSEDVYLYRCSDLLSLQEITAMLVADGVSNDKMLKNF